MILVFFGLRRGEWAYERDSHADKADERANEYYCPANNQCDARSEIEFIGPEGEEMAIA